MDTPQISLTDHQQWAVTISQEIEQMGWVGAAHALRRKHFPYLNWDDPKVRACTADGFEVMLHLHHGSKPPYTPTPSRPPVPELPSAIPLKPRDTFPLLPPKPSIHHGPLPVPQPMVAAPRADQIIS